MDSAAKITADLDAGWEEALRTAQDAYPDVRLDGECFAAHVEAKRASGAKAEHAPELFVSCAAGRGDAAALRHVERMIAPEADAAARRIDRAPAFADEVRQAMRVRLLVAEAGRARIDDYGGRGPLRGWIGVAAVRTALNLLRSRRSAEAVARAAGDASEVFGEVIAAEADPELRHLKTLYRAEFRDALTAALAALPERPRALLRLCYVDGLRPAALGRLYGVHETTAARWLARAAADVAEDARRRLIDRLAISPGSLDSVARMVLSNLDFSIARALQR